MCKIIAFAGSFDPMTNGHLWVIKEALKLVDNVRVIVANNPSKKYMFTATKRKEIIEQIVIDEQLHFVTVDIVENEYVASYLTNNNITHLVRGIRNSVDFDQEKLIQRVNSEILGNVQTIFLMAPSDLESVSSSFVKSLIGPENWPFYIKQFLPKAAYNSIFINIMKEKYSIKIEDDIISNVLKAYQNNTRYYHTLEHVMMLLSMLENNIDKKSETFFLLKYAILFHDAVYQHDVKASEITNSLPFEEDEYPDEILSSFIARECSTVSWNDKNYIEKIIRDTLYDGSPITTFHSNYMRFLDLSILGKPWVIYEDYMNNIRKEYRQYSDIEYKEGRINVLKKLINSFKDGTIYDMNCTSRNYSDKAIENMTKEISILSN